MKMTVEELKSELELSTNDVVFCIQGKNGLVIPRGSNRFTLCADDEEKKEYASIEELLNDPILKNIQETDFL